jgi:xanthine dehydrogenase YagT iron-sulfur-binding subunit
MTGARFEAFSGQPLLLVLAPSFSDPGEEVLEALRAELRALGAALLLIGTEHSFCFRPDDELVHEPSTGELRLAAIQLFRAHGVGPEALSTGTLLLGLLDDRGELRWRTSRAVDGDAALALLEATRLAGRSALRAPREPRVGLVTRREVVLTSLIGALSLVLLDGCKRSEPHLPVPGPSADVNSLAPATAERELTLNVNGRDYGLSVEPRVSLLDALRERLGLTGTKKGCDHGQCGACTVLLDGRRVNACLVLAVMVGERKITTIEGLAGPTELHPLQEAFVTHDALQCGYCTPGQIVSALGLLREKRAVSADAIREHMSGNLCRCGAYPNIVKAIQAARDAGGDALPARPT